VSWATLWAKAKENRARSKRMGWRGKGIVIGAMLAGTGGYNLYSDVSHQIRGRPAIATLMGRAKQCTIEYQPIGAAKRNEQWPCAAAEEFSRRLGADKVTLSTKFVAQIQFPLEDGRVYQADVDEVDLHSFKLAIGATLPVVYAPDDPADARPKMSWETLKYTLTFLAMLAVGSLLLALSLGVPLRTLLGWAFRGRENSIAQTPVDTSSRPTGTAPRTSFGMRNR
jgi:hypothetical protein